MSTLKRKLFSYDRGKQNTYAKIFFQLFYGIYFSKPFSKKTRIIIVSIPSRREKKTRDKTNAAFMAATKNSREWVAKKGDKMCREVKNRYSLWMACQDTSALEIYALMPSPVPRQICWHDGVEVCCKGTIWRSSMQLESQCASFISLFFHTSSKEWVIYYWCWWWSRIRITLALFNDVFCGMENFWLQLCVICYREIERETEREKFFREFSTHSTWNWNSFSVIFTLTKRHLNLFTVLIAEAFWNQNNQRRGENKLLIVHNFFGF